MGHRVDNSQYILVHIGCPKKTVPLSHNSKFFDPKKPLDLDTAQQNKQFSRTCLWDKGTFFFGTPNISSISPRCMAMGENGVNGLDGVRLETIG